jgi:hypothetical protein
VADYPPSGPEGIHDSVTGDLPPLTFPAAGNQNRIAPSMLTGKRVPQHLAYAVLESWSEVLQARPVWHIVRRQQRNAANTRNQRAEHGGATDRRCQQRYREKAAPVPMTDRGIPAIPMPTPPPTVPCQCAVWGGQSRWVDRGSGRAERQHGDEALSGHKPDSSKNI